MQHTIKNEKLCVVINSFGAEMNSIKSMDGTEYLWQPDPEIWDMQALNLFPYIARMTKESYVYDGKTYHMKIHGFINQVELEAIPVSESEITFAYESNDETREQYPFEFRYEITYRLEDNKLKIENKVISRDEKRMFFGIGGHPGFRVPLEDGLAFTDYRLEFANETHPGKVVFTPDCFLSGKEEVFPLAEGKILPLRHDLFDQDAIVLKNASRCVSICSDKGKKAVKVSFPDYPVVGFWHMPKMEAPYVCIEPWSSLPSRQDIVEDISQQTDLIALDAGGTYLNHWEIEIL